MSDFTIKPIPGSFDFVVEPIRVAATAPSGGAQPMSDYFRRELGLIPEVPPVAKEPTKSGSPGSPVVKAIQSSFKDSFSAVHTTTGRFKL